VPDLEGTVGVLLGTYSACVRAMSEPRTSPPLHSGRHAAKGERVIDVECQKEVAQRLRKIEGQVKGIQHMVEEPRLCIDILQQLSAVEAAIERVRVLIFRHHVRKCVPDAIKRGGADKNRRIAELADIVDQFCR
jgi:CsoR family transcriptional regulator, copper-sensing transcriptional repressor